MKTIVKTKYGVIVLLFLLIFLSICSKNPVKDNPFDPESGLDPSEWAPKNLNGLVQNIHSILLTWQRTDDRIDGFKIDRKTGKAAWLVEYAVVAKNIFEYMDTNAVPADTNIYRVYAYAGDNESKSIEANTIIQFPAPTNLQIQQISLSELRLTWQDNSNGEDGFKIDRKIADGNWDSAYAVVGENINSWTDDDPEINVENGYRVYGYRGNVLSNNISTVCENSIQAPSNLAVAQNGLTSIQITWHDGCEFETGYIIERSIAGGDYNLLSELSPNSEQLEDMDVELGETYQYRVAAQYESYLSEYGYSSSIRMGSLPEIPSNPIPANGATDQEVDVDLSWFCSDPDGDDLNYDVYFGTSSNPPLVMSNQMSTSYNPGTLAYNTIYYWKIVAKDDHGNSTSGPVWSFTTRQSLHETGTVTDIDGNTYQTVKIGDQWWMAENLKVTHYRNGDPIPNVTDNTDWSNLKTGAYCNYDNNDSNADTYGSLYNWYAINDSRNIAPTGWHVPSDEEWKELEMFLGMSQSEADYTGYRGTDEGGKLKETGTTHWNSPNTGATNESGFSALPGGDRGTNGGYDYMGYYAYFWSSTQISRDYAWGRGLGYGYSEVSRYYGYKRGGFSVRCVMGENLAPDTPSDPSPSDAETDQDINLSLSWTCSDPDSDPLTYDVYFGISLDPSLVNSNQSGTSYDPGSLSFNTKYYWKIVAKDDHGNSTSGPVWNFTTRSANAPNTPSNPSPSDGSVNQDINVDISWSCSHPDGLSMTYDIYFGTSSNPPLVKSDNTGTSYDPGTLDYAMTYYWKIVAKDDHNNETEGSVWSFETQSGTGTVTDIDDNTYQTVKIGDQWWMAENLKVTHYRNGDSIPNVTDNTTWGSLITGAYCNYDNNSSNADTYGSLYNWYAVNDSRNIAPEGWHVPSDAEWQTLVDYLGGNAVAGGKMKETGTTHWNSPNIGATNESGFSALPGGYRNNIGYYNNMGNYAYFWSSTQYGSYDAWYRLLYYGYSEVLRNYGYKRYGFSVRLVRD